MVDVPVVHTWYGVPITELPRKELETALIETVHALNDANGRLLKSRTSHIRDLAAMARQRKY